MSEKIGTFDLTCGSCDESFSAPVYEIDTGQKITSCRNCGRTVNAIGVEA